MFWLKIKKGRSIIKMAEEEEEYYYSDLFLELHCEKNEGGTRNLALRGNELQKQIGRRINDCDLVRIVLFLRKHEEIVSLDFCYNEITDCGMSTIVDFLEIQPVVRHLNVVGNDIGKHGIMCLVDLRDKMPLYSLRLTGNKFGDVGGEAISKLLRMNTSLKFLDLSDTHQTMTGLAFIMSSLLPSLGGTKTLEYIDISRPLPQPYHQINDGHAAEFVTQILRDNKSLKEIHLQQYRFDFRDMEIMLDGLLVNKTLVCLDLNNNNIQNEGVAYLSKYLSTSPALECLMIGANGISDLGALSLSYGLPFTKIKLLDISNNRITDDGMINIFDTIRKPFKMKAMYIWGNKLTHKSLVILKKLFKQGWLDPELCDVKLYCSGKEYHAAWNYQANRFTHRFYCESDYVCPVFRKLKYNLGPPVEKPPIYFKYHVDDGDLGFPMCEWKDD